MAKYMKNKYKTEEPDVPKETKVPEPEQEVQLVEAVGVELDVVPGLEWDDTEPEVYEDPKPAKDDVNNPRSMTRPVKSPKCLACSGTTTPSLGMNKRTSGWYPPSEGVRNAPRKGKMTRRRPLNFPDQNSLQLMIARKSSNLAKHFGRIMHLMMVHGR